MGSGPLRSYVIVTLMLSAMLLGASSPPSTGLELSYTYQVTNDSDREYDVSADVDSEGNYHLVYLISSDGDMHIFYAKVDPYGEMLAGPVEISPTDYIGNMGGLASDIDVDGNDDVHIVFYGWTDDPDDLGNIYYTKMSADGGTKLGTRMVFESSAASEFPRIGADDEGYAYIVWSEGVTPAELLWMKISPSGNIVEGEQRVSGDVNDLTTISFCDIAVTPSGVSYVIWQQNLVYMGQSSIHFTCLNQEGDALTDPTRIITVPGFDSVLPRCVVDSMEYVHMVYVRMNALTYEQYPRYARVSGSGEVMEDTTFTDQPFEWDWAPRIAINEFDDVGVAYSVETARDSGIYNSHLRIRWDENGTWEPSERLTGSSQSTAAALTMNGTCACVFLYVEDDIYLRRAQLRAINHPPYPYLFVSPSRIAAGEEVTLEGSYSHDPDGDDTVVGYFFDFGDGSDTGWISDPNVTHVYEEPGYYYPWLDVKDNHGLTSEYSDVSTVRVSEPPPNEPPTAHLSTTPNPVEPGQEVVLSGSSSTDPDGTVEEYSFEFGDGTSTGWTGQASVSHSYTEDGEYVASLTVRDDDGAESSSRSVLVTVRHVNLPPVATIVSIAPDPCWEGEAITLTGSGEDPDGTVEVYTWESDREGVLGSGAEVTVDSLESGLHTISFKVRDDDGAWSPVATRTVDVRANRPFTLVDATSKREVRTDGEMHFKVVYTDPDNDPPTLMNLLYARGDDWREVRLTETDPQDEDFTDGKEYSSVQSFEPGDYRYSFEAENEWNARMTTDVVTFQVMEEPVVPSGGLLIVMLAMLSVATVTKGRRRS